MLARGQSTGGLAGAWAEVRVGLAAFDGWGGLDADFFLGAFGELAEAAEGWCMD